MIFSIAHGHVADLEKVVWTNPDYFSRSQHCYFSNR